MRRIYEHVYTYIDDCSHLVHEPGSGIAERSPAHVDSYEQLVMKVASLAYKNPQYLLFFRGQKKDFKEGYSTTMLPPIFRGPNYELKSRYKRLEQAEEFLKKYYDEYEFEGVRQIRTHQILRWALLQHYEICPTPLLDITYSPRVACSFSGISDSSTSSTYVFVFGLPQISGSISVSSEHGIQNIRLLSVVPPEALRPHYQEGHLIGDYPTLGYAEKMENELRQVDFARRLICKFELEPGGKFQTIPDDFLFPPKSRDSFLVMAEVIRAELG